MNYLQCFLMRNFILDLGTNCEGQKLEELARLHLALTAFDSDFSIPGPYTNMSGEPLLNVNHTEAPTHYYLRDDSNLLPQRLKG